MTHYCEFDQFINNLLDNTQISDDEYRNVSFTISLIYDILSV